MDEPTTAAPSAAHYVASLLHDDRDTAEAVAAALQNLADPPPDALTLFEDGDRWRVDAYYPTAPEGRELSRMAAELAGLKVALPDFTVSEVPDVNWVAISQAALPPVTAGRFTVHGSHDTRVVPQGPNAILIDAGEAFGTAHHQTTAGCLMAIDRLSRTSAFENVLDLGCGSGVLAIAVARALPRARIIASDLDRVSVEVAMRNAVLNGVGSRIRCVAAEGLAHRELRARAPFDLVIANILARPLVWLAADLAAATAPGGTLLLSGLLIPQAAEIIAVYRAHGFRLERHDRVSGWSTLTLTRRA